MSGSLLRAEVHRFRSRRFVVVLLLLGLGVLLAGLALTATQVSKPDAASLAQAQQRVQSLVVEQEQGRQQCLRSVPAGQDPELACGPPLDASSFRAEDFLDEQPFVLAEAGPAGAAGLAGAAAALLFLVGATWIGAEWSTRAIVALLFWEPRRVRVVVTKLGVLAVAAAAVGAVTQLVWLGASRLLAETRGTTAGLAPGFYDEVLGIAGRGVLLGVLAAGLGFALAGLVRNTGAALGIGFAYVVVVENAVRVLRPGWQEWLLTNNGAALVQQGGLHLFVPDRSALDGTQRELVLTNLHGGLVLGVVTAALVGLSVLAFARRDLH